MSTDASPPDEDDPARAEGRLANLCRHYLRPPYLLAAFAVYLVLALLGLYASWRFWSTFAFDYLDHAGAGDYLLSPLSFLRLVIDPGFVAVWLTFTIVLALVAACAGYLVKRLRSSLRHAWPHPRQAPRAEVLPLGERWHDHETLPSYLRALSQRPLWAVPVLALAALLAINVDAAAEKRDLRSFARLVQHDYAKDRRQKLGPAYARYELVALPGLAAGRENLVRLRSTDDFVLYYDVLDDQPLVVGTGTAASAVAAARPAAAPDAELASDRSGTPMATGGVAAPPPAGGERSAAGEADGTLQIAQASAATAEPPGPSPSAPTARPGDRGSRPGVTLAIDSGADGNQSGAPAPPAARPPAPDAAGVTKPPSASAGQAAPQSELETIGTHLRGSQGSLQGLRSYVRQLEGNVVEIRKFIDDLDGSLSKIDQAVSQLSALQSAAAQLTYEDCAEMTAAEPLEFAAEDASLSLEAVGWLFQSRRQLTAGRSPDRKQWLVIEGRAAGEPTAEPPLAIRRAEAVRDFLQSELGVPPDAVKLVGKGAEGPSADLVSLYDCLRRQPVKAPTTAGVELGLVQSATAREVDQGGAVRPAAWTAGDAGSGLSALLADLDPQPSARGLLVTVPGDRLFDTDSFRIRTSAYGVLGRIGEALSRAPGHNALIVGHSDGIGDAAYNLILSEQRARAVRDFLVDRFQIDAGRLSIEGRGEDEPIATNDTTAGRLANRRIEVLLLD